MVELSSSNASSNGLSALLDSNLLDDYDMSHQLLLATGDDRGDGVDGSVWGKVTGNSLLPAISMIGREFKLMISLNSTADAAFSSLVFFARIERSIIPKRVDKRTISFFQVDPNHDGL